MTVHATIIRSLGAFAALLVVAAAMALTAPTAHAHNVLVSSDPVDGARLTEVPEQIALIFNDDVLDIGAGVRVEGPDGDIQVGKPKVAAEAVTQRVRSDAAPGRYTVTWRVTSADGHPINGTFTFRLAQPADEADEAPSAKPTAEPAEATSAAAAPAEDAQSADEDNRLASNVWLSILIPGAIGAALGIGWVVLTRRNKARG